MVKEEVMVRNENRVSAAQLERLLQAQLDMIRDAPAQAKVLPPLMVWGPPGVGKSSIMRAVAESRGIGFIDVRLAQREPVDIRGLPVPTDDGVVWQVSAEWPRDPKSRGIILFDEITAADRSLQVAAYEFILDRRLGNLYSVPDGWYICAAGNRAEDRAVAGTMSSALANRFMHVELQANVEDWVAWAVAQGLHPSVTGFIRYRPALLFHQEEENLERGWPTPRSWERVARMLKALEGRGDDLVRKAVYGLVGDGAGVEFLAFHKINDNFANVLRMMLDPSVPVVIPETADRKYAIAAAAVYHLWRGENGADSKARLDGFFRICMAFTSDFACLAMTDALGPATSPEAAKRASMLLNHPRYAEWKAKYGAAFKKHIAL
jgi:hypothetical protein